METYMVVNKVFDTKAQAEYEIHHLKNQMRMIEMEREVTTQANFRSEIGLTELESKAKVKFSQLQVAVTELAYAHAMDKNDFVIKESGKTVAVLHDEYMMICKNVFKLCMQHGLKSEYMI